MLELGRPLRGQVDEQPAAAARHEDAGRDHDPEPVELRPAEHLLERESGDAGVDHPAYVVGVGGLGLDQGGLLLGEHAAGGPELLDDHGSMMPCRA